MWSQVLPELTAAPAQQDQLAALESPLTPEPRDQEVATAQAAQTAQTAQLVQPAPQDQRDREGRQAWMAQLVQTEKTAQLVQPAPQDQLVRSEPPELRETLQKAL